jgi:hypothetical protein
VQRVREANQPLSESPPKEEKENFVQMMFELGEMLTCSKSTLKRHDTSAVFDDDKQLVFVGQTAEAQAAALRSHVVAADVVAAFDLREIFAIVLREEPRLFAPDTVLSASLLFVDDRDGVITMRVHSNAQLRLPSDYHVFALMNRDGAVERIVSAHTARTTTQAEESTSAAGVSRVSGDDVLATQLRFGIGSDSLSEVTVIREQVFVALAENKKHGPPSFSWALMQCMCPSAVAVVALPLRKSPLSNVSCVLTIDLQETGALALRFVRKLAAMSAAERTLALETVCAQVSRFLRWKRFICGRPARSVSAWVREQPHKLLVVTSLDPSAENERAEVQRRVAPVCEWLDACARVSDEWMRLNCGEFRPGRVDVFETEAFVTVNVPRTRSWLSSLWGSSPWPAHSMGVISLPYLSRSFYAVFGHVLNVIAERASAEARYVLIFTGCDHDIADDEVASAVWVAILMGPWRQQWERLQMLVFTSSRYLNMKQTRILHETRSAADGTTFRALVAQQKQIIDNTVTDDPRSRA